MLVAVDYVVVVVDYWQIKRMEREVVEDDTTTMMLMTTMMMVVVVEVVSVSVVSQLFSDRSLNFFVVLHFLLLVNYLLFLSLFLSQFLLQLL